MSSGKNLDNGFSFEINVGGRQQMWVSVLYMHEEDKFMITTGMQDSIPTTNEVGQRISNTLRSEQTYLIDRDKAHILINAHFWHSIGDWADKLAKELSLK